MEKYKLYKLVSLVFVLTIVSGCSQINEIRPQVAASPDKVSLMLAESADRASTALYTLAAIEEKKTPGVEVSSIANAPAELRRAVTINWIGPAEQVTQKMAERAGYNFTTIGARPHTPLVVNIDVENRQVIDVLRDIGLQLGQRANLKVDSQSKTVEIHYTSMSGMRGME